MKANYDFSGWATKNDLLCSDGRTIRHGAFRGCDGKEVDLVWNHRHKDPKNKIGRVLLKNTDEGVRAYGSFFSDSPKAMAIRDAVIHGKLNNLSIYANDLVEKDGEVFYGDIQEVSLVQAGANPGAMIDTVIAHSADPEYDFDEKNRGVLFSGEPIVLYHSEEGAPEEKKEEEDMLSHADTKEVPQEEEKKQAEGDDKTVEDVVNSMSEEQKNVMYFLIGKAAEDAQGGNKEDSKEEEKEVKHNVFEGQEQSNELIHMDMGKLLADAKRVGSLKEAYIQHCEANDIEDEEGAFLQHDGERYGIMAKPGDANSLGIDALFPEYRTVGGATPEWIKRDTGWVDGVMRGVHHTPFSRIKSIFADITEDDARARGYMKGNRKKEEVFSLLKRTTDPQTIYKKQKLDRDDVIDITDFDVVAWIKAEMRMMLDEEIARAILVGDGRAASSDDKISQDHVRSIYLDDDFYSNKVAVQVPANADEDTIAKKTIRTIIKARKDYKGSGNPVFYTTADVLTDMLLLEDSMGRIIYDTEEKLRTALRVSKIVEVEVLEGQTRTDSNNVTRPLIGIIVNLSDYNVGADKGGAVAMFEDFDIDYNQQKYLIETRLSGALIKPHSAMVIELEQAVGANG